MNGKLVGGGIVTLALVGGIALYYLQVYHFYEPVAAQTAEASMRLENVATGEAEDIIADDFQGIDADSSPLRFRACFTTQLNHALASETYVLADKPVPLTAPGWFDCFDAEALGADLESGDALAFVSQTNIADGVDRIIAIYDDGRAFAWHQLNEKYAE